MALSRMDRSLVVALRRSPRASYATLAAETGADERTVRRSLERLREDGTLAFSASVLFENARGYLVAQLELNCRPDAVDTVARALADRDDTRFVAVTTGGADVVADLTVPDTEALHAVITSELSALEGVSAIRTQIVMRLLFTAVDWDPDGLISDTRRRATRGEPAPATSPLDATDLAIAAALREDIRAPLSRVARDLDIHETTVQRRLNRMLHGRALQLRADVEPAAFGYAAESRFTLSVRPADQAAALRTLAADPALRALYVVTGPASILGYSVHSSLAEMHDLLDGPLAGISGLLGCDLAVVLRAYKRAGITL
ncbi:Lrp/AsnC family transcriptional regulator [Streptomyces sp. NPDC052042]|uniref:Lrp/AsnC family transcriptional regulator n=1 Tax=Streptomyces sp. NPDC052042 TaxID=3365683 RepID=UPI0037CCE8D9